MKIVFFPKMFKFSQGALGWGGLTLNMWSFAPMLRTLGWGDEQPCTHLRAKVLDLEQGSKAPFKL